MVALVGLLLVTSGGFGAAAVSGGRAPVPSPARLTPADATALIGRLPLSFEPVGADRFVARSLGSRVAVDGGDAVISLASGPLRIALAGRSATPVVRPGQPQAAKVNYFVGDDPSRWRAGVTSFGEVAYDGVWPGVDAVWHGRQQELEVDFVVAPGADPGVVAMTFAGADDLRVDRDGALVVRAGDQAATLRAPTLYQDGRRGREAVDGSFVLRGADEAGFHVGAYDHSRPLIIDPVLVSSTYLGGSSSDTAQSVAIDGSGNVYVTGSTESSDFPIEGPVQADLIEANGVRTEAYVTKLNPAGSALVYSTYLGGKGHDIGYGIAVGNDGSPYVAGSTDSSDFPLSKAFKRTYGGGTTDAFVTKLGPQGAALDYSTFLGGGGADVARGIALDQSGAAIVAGSTSSTDFPVAKAFQGALKKTDDPDAFVAKISPPGAELLYSTFLGGGAPDHATSVAVDGSGAAYVAGDTRSSDFPTANALQSVANGGGGLAESASDAFVTKFDANGGALAYSTFLGGSEADQASGIAVDRDGSAYVTGNTSSTNFPVVRPVQAKKNGDTDAFVSRLSSAGSTLIFSTYLGGSGSDGGTSITVDRLGRASLTGATASNDFPLAKPFQGTKAGGLTEAFVSTLGTDGSSLAFSSYLGGRDEDLGSAIVSDHDGNLYVAGYTNSPDFPTAHPFQPAKGGGVGDAFVAKVGDQAPKATGSTSTSPERERRIQFLLATTIVLFTLAIGHTLWLRRRRIPTGPRPAGLPASAFGGMPVGRIEGSRYDPPRGVRRVAPAPPGTGADRDDDGGDDEPPLPLIAPVRPLGGARAARPVPPPVYPPVVQPESGPETEPEPAAADAAHPEPEPEPEPAAAGAPADLVPEDPALSEAWAESPGWAESPVSDDQWAPEADGDTDAGPDADLAVPDLLPEPEAPAYGEQDAEMWQMMTVDPDPVAAGEAARGQSMSELLAEDMPGPAVAVPLDDGISISELLDDEPPAPPDEEEEPEPKPEP